MDINYTLLLDDSIFWIMRNALRISLRRPSMLGFFLKAFLRQKRMAKRRNGWEKQGIHVPPFMIASITNRCNLHCKGCYNQALHSSKANEMSPEKLIRVIGEASELGISFILLAGGEPLVRAEITELAVQNPNVIFPLFTNGMLINAEKIKSFKHNKNLVPVISLEGYGTETDLRRGEGVYGQLTRVFKSLKEASLFFGTSITVTRENFSLVTGDAFISELVSAGCSLFFFVEYIPVSAGTEQLVLDDIMHRKLQLLTESLREKYSALFVVFPGDEEMFGGCLSAGRGFVHLNPEGRLEPCPFAPYSDTGVNDVSLKDALQSDFLRKIRENHEMLTETAGGCALWEKRDWVRSLL
jgi:MoaA/NifB/PqqE/SkfB family radical SAM enzyme